MARSLAQPNLFLYAAIAGALLVTFYLWAATIADPDIQDTMTRVPKIVTQDGAQPVVEFPLANVFDSRVDDWALASIANPVLDIPGSQTIQGFIRVDGLAGVVADESFVQVGESVQQDQIDQVGENRIVLRNRQGQQKIVNLNKGLKQEAEKINIRIGQ